MRRLVLGLLAGVTTLSVVSSSSPTEASTGDPTVNQSVVIHHRTMDLTDGEKFLVLRVTGSADKRLDLRDVVLATAGNQHYISTEDHPSYRMGRHAVTKLSGDSSSGVWRVRIPLHRHLPADTWSIGLTWEVGRTEVWRPLTRTVTVVNPHSDTRAPVLLSLDRPAEEATFSVSDEPHVSMHLRARGAGLTLVWVCYLNTDNDNEDPCDEAHLASGTPHDGVWKTRMTHFDLLHAGDSAFRIILEDDATNDSIWDPQDQPIDAGLGRVIPDGRGDFTLTD